MQPRKYQDGERAAESDVPVVMVWLIFYAIAVVGSLTAPAPTTPLLAVAAATSE